MCGLREKPANHIIRSCWNREWQPASMLFTRIVLISGQCWLDVILVPLDVGCLYWVDFSFSRWLWPWPPDEMKYPLPYSVLGKRWNKSSQCLSGIGPTQNGCLVIMCLRNLALVYFGITFRFLLKLVHSPAASSDGAFGFLCNNNGQFEYVIILLIAWKNPPLT